MDGGDGQRTDPGIGDHRPRARRPGRPNQIRPIRVSAASPPRIAGSASATFGRGRQRPTDPEQRLRLARPPRGILGPVRLERREPADHDRHEQQEEQVEPLRRVLDGEREPGATNSQS